MTGVTWRLSDLPARRMALGLGVLVVLNVILNVASGASWGHTLGFALIGVPAFAIVYALYLYGRRHDA
jgi:hypothetical protein